MPRVFLADSLPVEQSALRLILTDLKMKVVGEASDWAGILAKAPASLLNILLVSWELLPTESPALALANLRVVYPDLFIIVLTSPLDTRQQTALVSGADAFISRADTPDRVILQLQMAATRIHPL